MDISQAASTIAQGIVAPPAQAAAAPPPPAEDPNAPAPPAAAAAEVPRKSATAFNLLTKKEAALHRERQALAAEREAFGAERSKMSNLIKAQQLLDQGDELGAIQALGTNYDRITEKVIGSTPTVESEIAALRKEIEDQKTAKEREKEEAAENLTKAQKEAVEKGIAQFKGEISQFIAAKSDDFPLCAKMQPIELMYMVAEQTYEATGRILTVTELSSNVEKYLEDQFEEAFALPKFASRFQKVPPKEETPLPAGRDVPRSSAPPRTITNAMTPSAQPSAPRTYSSAQDVEQDAIRRALAAMQRGG